MGLTWPSFNFFHCDFEGDEERGRQKLKPNILSLSFDIFNPDFLFIQIYYYLLISLAVKYSQTWYRSERHWENKLFPFPFPLHINVLKLVRFLSSCKNKIMKAHDVFYFIKLKTMISPSKEIWQSWILNSVPWILHSGFFVSGTWIPVISGTQSTCLLFQIPREKFSRFRIPLHGVTVTLRKIRFLSN